MSESGRDTALPVGADPGGASDSRPAISVLVCAFNEEGNVELAHRRLTDTLAAYGKPYEIVFVEDGSTDRTFEILKGIHDKDPAVHVVRFARNFGQQMAVAAGLKYARGDVVVLIDADLQNAPEEIPLLVDTLAQGYDIVYGVRRERRDPLWRRMGSWGVSYLLYRLTGIRIPDSASSFIAIDRRLVDHINLYQDKTKYFSGLFAWLSYGRCGAVPVSHAPRHAGQSKYTLAKLVRTALNFMCSFTELPLHLAFYAGWLIVGMAGLAALGLAVTTSWRPLAWMAVLVSFFGGVQLVSVGILGQYLGRVYREVREQPAFVVSEILDRRP